jgi:hydroxyethylthiazole kinase
MMKDLKDIAAHNLTAIREKKPLIHNITNFVVMNYTANALLAMGASPVMAHAQNEVEDMVSFAGALVLNIGTLTDDWIHSMIKAGKKASEKGTPIILDPVGSGATALRTDSAKKIIEQTRISVIRGNASEILSLRHAESKTKGVDSIHSVEEAAKTATVIRVANGHPLMGYVTGTGCTATVTIGAFLAVDADPVSATATALAYFGLAGEVAAQNASAPGSFMIQMIDALYTITPEDLKKGCKIEEN